LRQGKPGAKLAFAAGHLALIGLMIVSGQMEQAVENEHLDLRGERMALLDGLTERGGHADS
jgi:hypothetical protein